MKFRTSLKIIVVVVCLLLCSKLIGARHYTGEGARDIIGHGVHSIHGAWSCFCGDKLLWNWQWNSERCFTASRIVAYKVCFKYGCRL